MEIHELNTKTITNPAYVALDDGVDTYKLDLNAKLSSINTALTRDAANIENLLAKHTVHFCETATAAATSTKVVTTSEYGGADGEYIAVKFTNGNTASSISFTIGNLSNGTVVFPGHSSALKIGYDNILIFRVTDEAGVQPNPVWKYTFVGYYPLNATTSADGLMSSSDKSALDTAVTDISSLKSDFDDITTTVEPEKPNIFDISAITANTYIDTSGNATASANFSVTDYIPVTEGDKIYWWCNRGGYEGWMYFDARFLCAYDSNKSAVSASGGTFVAPPYTVPSGIAYIRLSISNTYLNAWSDWYAGQRKNTEGFVAYGAYTIEIDIPESITDKFTEIDGRLDALELTEASYTVQNGGSILSGLKYCYANGIKHLIVEAGTYDVIAEYESEYGSDYFTNYTNYATTDAFDRGLWLENIKVTFSAGSKVVCKYTGNNTAVGNYFSAFATGNNVIIDGLVLDSENLRYGIHSDFNSTQKQTYFIVRNCDLKHYKNSTSMQAIGAGFGIHVLWLIEDTIFRSAGGNHIVFRVHNNVSDAAQSKLIVRDCYIDGEIKKDGTITIYP